MKDHDCLANLDTAIRVGRAKYACEKCGKDVSMAWFSYQSAIKDADDINSTLAP